MKPAAWWGVLSQFSATSCRRNSHALREYWGILYLKRATMVWTARSFIPLQWVCCVYAKIWQFRDSWEKVWTYYWWNESIDCTKIYGVYAGLQLALNVWCRNLPSRLSVRKTKYALYIHLVNEQVNANIWQRRVRKFTNCVHGDEIEWFSRWRKRLKESELLIFPLLTFLIIKCRNNWWTWRRSQ